MDETSSRADGFERPELRELARAEATRLVEGLVNWFGTTVEAALKEELQLERATTRAVRLECEKAQRARARAEEACEEAEAARHRLAMTLEKELRDVRAELDVQRGELARVLQQLESERAERMQPIPSARPKFSPSPEQNANAVTAAPPASESVADPAVESSSRDAVLRAGAALVLREVEAMYQADAAAGMPPAELADRLAARLRDARQTYVRRLAAAGAEDNGAFDRELTGLIDQRASEALGRHLAVASYALDHAPAAAAGPVLAARAS